MLPGLSFTAFMLATAGAYGVGGEGAPVNPVGISNESVSKVTTDGSVATASFTFKTDRTVKNQDNINIDPKWLDSGYSASSYSIRVTVNSGTTPTGTIGSWLVMSVDRTWSLSQSAGQSGTKSCSLKVEIKENSSGAILDTATYTLSADSQPAGSTTTYSPVPGSYTDEEYSSASLGVSASASVTWNWSATNSTGLTSSVASGDSASSILFTLLGAPTTDRSTVITLNSGGKTWTLSLTAYASDTDHCVTVDTPILVDPTGREVAAGDIKAGDEIYTQHEETLEWGMFPVLANFILRDQEVLSVLLNGKRLRATPDHRFYVGGAWRTIKELGGHPDGKADIVKMTVARAHTYISAGVLSHNIKL